MHEESEEGHRLGQLADRIRRGELAALEELIDRYRPQLERYIRVCLSSPAAATAIDSEAVLESVFNAFIIRISAGTIEIGSDEKLLSLFHAMTRNKLLHSLRSARAQRRDYRRNQSLDGIDLAAATDTPSEQVALSDLVESFRKRLSAEELRIAEMRGNGLSWDEIGTAFQSSGESVRKLLMRAVDRVCSELDI